MASWKGSMASHPTRMSDLQSKNLKTAKEEMRKRIDMVFLTMLCMLCMRYAKVINLDAEPKHIKHIKHAC